MPRHHRRHERAADYFNQSLSSKFPDYEMGTDKLGQGGQRTCAGAFPISERGQVPRAGAIIAPDRTTHPITSGQLVWNISPRGLSMRS